MSQAKVDRYKEEKKNRKKIMKKEKTQNVLLRVCGVVVCAAVVVWIGVSAVGLSKSGSEDTTAETTSYTLDTSALDAYSEGLSEE